MLTLLSMARSEGAIYFYYTVYIEQVIGSSTEKSRLVVFYTDVAVIHRH